jgi:CRISPR-associated endonuclease/helicase Cas3
MPMSFSYLLAKSPRTLGDPDAADTLLGHVHNTLAVAKTLVDSWGLMYLDSMALPREWLPAFTQSLLAACALHDLGKATLPFQQLLRSRWKGPLPCPHEVVSLFILLKHPELGAWLFSGHDTVVRLAATWAVVGHHLRFEGQAEQRWAVGQSYVMVLSGHADVARILESTRPCRGGTAPPTLTNFELDLAKINHTVTRWSLEQLGLWDAMSDSHRRFVSVVKGLLVAADVAGSALPRSRKDPAQWARDAQQRVAGSIELEDIATARLEGKPLRNFQEQVRDTQHRVTLLLAGCGSGKTTAAYQWASRKGIDRKVFFCYPTTGTATAGFADYILPVEGIDATLMHSRAEMDIAELRSTPTNRGEEGKSDDRIGLESLAAWDVPLVVCTADTVLGLIQNQRRGVFSLPSVLQGAFVFDEIHAYDERMFRSLLHFLGAFHGCPVLLMTASLPDSRRKALAERMQRLDESLDVVYGPEDLETCLRYALWRTDHEDALRQTKKALARGEKVLWVVNTVARAVELAQQLTQLMPTVVAYHSRYRYVDRLRHHNAVIHGFRGKEAFLAVTTQTAEMSLDISADLLITELAPPTALIQRLGRLNRYAAPGDSPSWKPCLIVEPPQPAPYCSDDLAIGTVWLDRLGEGRPVSQRDLAAALNHVSSDQAFPILESAWLDGGPLSQRAPLRDPGYSISIIRVEDSARASEDRRAAIGCTIPMPLRPVIDEISEWQRIGTARVAPAGRVDYCERWGARWREQQPPTEMAGQTATS